MGVVNPAVEFAISPKSTLQTDIVISPWKSINEKHMLFAIFMGEYRRYFKEHNRGWYLGANIGMMAFDMSKPLHRRVETEIRRPLLQRIRHDDRPLRGL